MELDGPFQLLPGNLSSRRHIGVPECSQSFSAIQREEKELVEVPAGFAEALTFGLVGRSESMICFSWNAVKTTKTTVIQNIFKGAKHYPLPILV